ncbi:MAG: hypothetical protein J2P19_32800, partial [Pseudonocardia sp.]|nr:hypothetical protein [Pseudonocardia sp.]
MSRIITDAHVAATARVAARILEDEGWCRGDYAASRVASSGHCRYCLMGAIAVAAGAPPHAWEVRAATADEAMTRTL